ncbi:MAG: hypothetical protein P8104_06195 [Gammaproteobacteria bacterium]
MKMIKEALSSAIVLASLSMPTVSNAVPRLSFGSASTDFSVTHSVGDTFGLEVWLSGLNDVDLGGFELSLAFDASPIAYTSTTFSDELLSNDFFGLQANEVGAGHIDLSGVSLATDLSQQADTLHLFTLNFDAQNVGVSELTFTNTLFSDALAQAFEAEAHRATVTVTSTPPSVNVSEPETVSIFFVLGAVMLGGVRRWRLSQNKYVL